MSRFLLVASYPESLLNFRGPLIAALQQSGQEVHCAAPGLGSGSEVAKALVSRGVITHDIPMQRTGVNPLVDLRTLWSLWRLMRRIHPHHVLGYTIKPVIYGSLAAWLAWVPKRHALITGLGYAFQNAEQRGVLQALVQVLYRLSLGRTHKVFFQNPDDQALFRQRGIIPSRVESVVVNGSGIDVARFTVAPFPASADGVSISFLLIARLLGDKGVREYVEAARLVKGRFPSAAFRLVGYIDDNPDSVTQAELDGWVRDGVVDYLGRLTDVRPAIADCSVYVLPSYREGTPRTVLEAMAMGRPVITTDAPGCRETVVNGDNGFLVPVKDAAALSLAMSRFLDRPGLVERMGRRSREIAEEKYDVHKVNVRMLSEMDIR